MQGRSEPSCASRLVERRHLPRAVNILCAIIMAAGILALVGVAARFILAPVPLPDFEYFYKAGVWLYQHGGLDPGYDRLADGSLQPRGSVEWYWPFVSRIWTLVGWLPHKPAGLVWMAINLASLLVTFRLLDRWFASADVGGWHVSQVIPFALLGLCWYWEFRLSQINILVMALLLGSYACCQLGRPFVSGLWLGLAILLKITPLFLVLWFLLKRQYRVVAATLLTVVIAGPVADAIVFGPVDALGQYRHWYARAVEVGSQRALIMDQREMDWRNQSLGAVVSRWLHPTSYGMRFDNDPRAKVQHAPVMINVADLPLPTIVLIVAGASAASVLALAWLARKPASALTPWQLRCEWALFFLAMLWLMPVMRRYHMIWALPAMSVLVDGIARAGWRSRWTWGALAALGFMVLGQIGMAWKPAEAGGAGLLPVFGLALALAAGRIGSPFSATAARPSPTNDTPACPATTAEFGLAADGGAANG